MSRPDKASLPKIAIPAEIHAALVETLFGTLSAFVAGVLGGLPVPIVAWARTGDPIYMVCTGVMLVVAAARLSVFCAYHQADKRTRDADAGRWEMLYAVGAIGFMLCVGVTTALLFHQHRDGLTELYGMVMAVGSAGSFAARNSGRPAIARGQVIGICVPLILVFLIDYSAWYWGLAAMLVLLIVAVKSTSKTLNEIIVAALLNGREATIQRIMFGTALDSMSHGLCMGDNDGAITVVNRRLREFFHLSAATDGLQVQGLAEMIALSGRLPPARRAAFVNAWAEHVEKRVPSMFSESIDGRTYDFRCEPKQQGGFVILVEDVTSARIASQKIEHMAHFDDLTGLPNRGHFHDRLQAALEHPMTPGQQMALLSIDLDQFKEVNDTRGHPTGDELLRLVAKRLRQCVQPGDLVARFGGDEFQVLLKTSSDLRHVGQVADRVIERLSQSYRVDGHIITIGASVGVAVSFGEVTGADDLLRSADMALYQAKADGRGIYRVFNPAMDAALQRKREIGQILREAIAKGELELRYQPVVDDRTGRIVSCEALVCLRHPTEGQVSPSEFIPIAEETGLIVALGRWVLRRACQEATSWPEQVRVAVNFSPKQFVISKDLVGDIRDALAETGLEPGRLEVEITESTMIEAKDALTMLCDISALGCKISLDDFGTGYSSLSYLRQFPVDKIKIDRSFAQDIKSRASQAVIGSVSVLAQLLNVELVIEGVETQEQLAALKAWNVHLIQGYFFCRPRPIADIRPMLFSPAPFARPRIQSVA